MYKMYYTIVMKKPTISDVAAMANVCKATVSYVLNDNQSQKISESTQKRIWQAVNILNYKPNIYAKNLRGSQDMRTIAIYYPEQLPQLARLAMFDMVQTLSSELKLLGNSVQILSGDSHKVDTADAIVALGIDKLSFYSMGDCNFIPLIAVDSIIDDALFYDVSIDYSKLSATASSSFGDSYTYVCTTPRDDALAKVITDTFAKVIFVDTYSQLLQLPSGNVLTTESAIAEAQLTSDKYHLLHIDDLAIAKAKQAIVCIEHALSHKQYDTNSYRV